jgi:hypothetical protein
MQWHCSPQRALGVFSVLVLLTLSLSGCETQSAVTVPASPTATPTLPTVRFAAPIGTPGALYPWAMQHQVDPTTGQTIWVPVDAGIEHFMQEDFLRYWVWSGQAGVVNFPFVPDAAQIPQLATPTFAGHLQQYVEQMRSSGRLTIYNTNRFLARQLFQGCTPDGLQCQVNYDLGLAARDVYNNQTGDPVEPLTDVYVLAVTTQVYDEHLQVWQLSALFLSLRRAT